MAVIEFDQFYNLDLCHTITGTNSESIRTTCEVEKKSDLQFPNFADELRVPAPLDLQLLFYLTNLTG